MNGMKAIDLTGEKYGRWTVVENLGYTGPKKYYWCRCECGTERRVPHGDLHSGKSKSCGCLKSELQTIRNTTHGKRDTRLFSIWSGMKTRCYNENTDSFKYYGGKGVIICDEWLNDFQTFYDWSMSNGYWDNLTIDRIDVNGNYAPDNCRWTTYKIQSTNRTNNHFVRINNETKALSEWAEESGINYHTVQDRLRRGWSHEAALFEPLRR